MLSVLKTAFWSTLVAFNPSHDTTIPLKMYPIYKACGDDIPAKEKEYFPSGLAKSAWILQCHESTFPSGYAKPRLRPKGLTN